MKEARYDCRDCGGLVSVAMRLRRGIGDRRQCRSAMKGLTVDDVAVRSALGKHWAASELNDVEQEHRIYDENAVLDYPQSGERICGRKKIQMSRAAQPNRKHFSVRRIVGKGDLWVTEFVLTYDGRPSYAVSIMEFVDGQVVHETQYFGDPFNPGPSRAQWVERIP